MRGGRGELVFFCYCVGVWVRMRAHTCMYVCVSARECVHDCEGVRTGSEKT